jgi:4-amino-4-deoxy-L-arabinose transferase-like glycosyltransferase
VTEPEDDADPTVPPGNRLRPWALFGVVAGAAVPFLLMCMDVRWRWSVPLGFAGCAVAAIGLLCFLGSFDDPEERVAHRVGVGTFLGRVLEVAIATAALVASLTLAVAGVLPRPVLTAAVLVTLTFLALVVAVYRCGRALGAWRVDPDGAERGLLERHGFWLVVLTTVLYLPLLGSYSLSDPWETHYGEVAREMLARDDWISLWWAQDGWFWSKPIFDFWIQGLCFSALGVRWAPDQMLAAAAHGHFPQPEWAARMPVFALTLLAGYFLYKVAARAWGRRAGLLGGVVLVTMPYWFLIGHQTMTDMPYVAPMCVAMALILLGAQSDPDELVRCCEVRLFGRTLRLSAYHLLVGLLLLSVIPQVLYLASRNVLWHVAPEPGGLGGAARRWLFEWRPDQFFAGSGGGNAGLPGNQGWTRHDPVHAGELLRLGSRFRITAQPIGMAVLWSVVLGLLLWLERGERRVQRLCFLGAWLFTAYAAMAKGAPGLVLPVAVLGAWIAVTRRWRDLLRVEPLALLLIVLCVALPWYVQMYMRHGWPFIDRLIFHDMYKRAFVHVHDTNAGDDTSFRYYVWQLGYGLFPWTGLAAGGLVWWLRRREDTRDGEVASLLVLWFVAAFGMFTITLTKFHHYVFPLVPPTAMLLGVLLDRALAPDAFADRRARWPYLASMLGAASLLVYGSLRFFPGAIGGVLKQGQPRAPAPLIAAASLGAGLLLIVIAARGFGRRADPPRGDGERWESYAIGAVGVAAAMVVALAGRDLFTSAPGDVEGPARLMHLFTYNYRRPWPSDSLSFSGILTAFTIVSAGLCLLLSVRRWRNHTATLLLCSAVLWAAWGIDVYLYRSSPHWGQRETVLEYYRRRGGPNEPFVAYQMNWKGENFYAGNRVPAFVSSGQKFKDWVEEQKKKGVRVMWFTTEHGRVGSLKNELGNPPRLEVVTSKELNNKFMLARVEL